MSVIRRAAQAARAGRWGRLGAGVTGAGVITEGLVAGAGAAIYEGYKDYYEEGMDEGTPEIPMTVGKPKPWENEEYESGKKRPYGDDHVPNSWYANKKQKTEEFAYHKDVEEAKKALKDIKIHHEVNHKHDPVHVKQTVVHSTSSFSERGRYAHEYFNNRWKIHQGVGVALGMNVTTPMALSTISRGTDSDERIGDIIKYRELNIHGYVENQGGSITHNSILLIVDKRPNGSGVQNTDVLRYDKMYSTMNLTNKARFKCLKRWDFVLIGTATTPTSRTAETFQHSIQLNEIAEYGDDFGLATDMITGALYLVVVCEETTTNQSQISVNWNLCFSDKAR